MRAADRALLSRGSFARSLAVWSLAIWSLAIWSSAVLFSTRALALTLVDYPHAQVLSATSASVDDYRLTLGELKKVNSRWRAEREQRLAGELERKTLELDADYFAAEGFEHYRRQLLQAGGRELYYCESRRCGSSNAWANTRFHVKQLYGLDSDQFYSAFEVIDDDEKRSYVALYAVRRGNDRNYLQLEVLRTSDSPRISSSTEAIVERLATGQSFVFVDALQDSGELETEHLESLLSVMKRKRGWVIGLVGHNYSPNPLEIQRQRSREMVAKIRQQMIDSGVDAERIEVFGLGGLVPAVRLGQREALIQVVLIRR